MGAKLLFMQLRFTQNINKLILCNLYIQYIYYLNIVDNELGNEGIQILAEQFHFIPKLRKLNLGRK